MEVIKSHTQENEIISLTKFLNEAANNYYNGKSEITDELYDSFLDRLEILEKQSGFRLANSPTKRVGFKVLDKINKVKLPQQMLSLDKIKNDLEKLEKFIGKEICLMTLKLDGISCCLHYKSGKLIGCYTRGNGIEGSDVTAQVSILSSVPNRILVKEEMLVFGELIIKKNNFENINKTLLSEEKFANPRNLISGTINSLDTGLAKKRFAQFVAFNSNRELNQSSRMTELQELGFEVSQFVKCCKDSFTDNIQMLKEYAERNHYPIDGIVVTYNEKSVRDNLGQTSKFPLHSIAYKFQDVGELTSLKDIEWNMSRNLTLTPIAIFDTVEIDGTDVSRASLHNVSILKHLELGIGDIIEVTKANQIIPQVIFNKTKSNNYQIPKYCPYCGQATKLETSDTIILKCTNQECSQAKLLQIEYILSKDVLNVKGISEQILKQLKRYKIVEDIFDVLELPNREQELINRSLPGLKRKTINNICEGIRKTHKITLDKFIMMLDIDSVGNRMSKQLSNKFENLINFLNADVRTLTQIDGISEITSYKILKYLDENVDYILKLKEYFDIATIEKITNTEFKGLNFVFTGKTIEFQNRKAVEEYITSRQGKMMSSVNINTNYLICNGVENTSKYKKAMELGVKIITDKELREI